MSEKPLLYYSITSAPARAVLLTAQAIGIDLDLHEVCTLRGEHLTPEFKKLNPQHTIPLLNDNGNIIYDSHAICGYLCDKYAEDDILFPKDLVKRSRIVARMHFNSGYLFCRLRNLYEPILFSGITSIPQETIDDLEKCWEIMEAFLNDSDYLCGFNLTIADLCCITTVTSVDHEVPIDPVKYPKFTGWINRMCDLPFFENLNTTGAEELKQMLIDKLKENQYKIGIKAIE